MDKLNENKSFIPNVLNTGIEKKVIVNFVPVNYKTISCNNYIDIHFKIKNYFESTQMMHSVYPINLQQEINLKFVNLLNHTTFPNYLNYCNTKSLSNDSVILDDTDFIHMLCEEKLETLVNLISTIKQKISFAQIDIIYTNGTPLEYDFENLALIKLVEKIKHRISEKYQKTINFRTISEAIKAFNNKKESNFFIFLNISLTTKEVGEFFSCLFKSFKEDPINFFVYQLFLE